MYVHMHMCRLCSHEWYIFISSQGRNMIAFNLIHKQETLKQCVSFVSGEQLVIQLAVFCNVNISPHSMQIADLDM